MAAHLAAVAVALGIFAAVAFLGGDHRSGRHLTVLGGICVLVALLMLFPFSYA